MSRAGRMFDGALALALAGVLFMGCRTPTVVRGEPVVWLEKGTLAPYDGYLVDAPTMSRILEKIPR